MTTEQRQRLESAIDGNEFYLNKEDIRAALSALDAVTGERDALRAILYGGDPSLWLPLEKPMTVEELKQGVERVGKEIRERAAIAAVREAAREGKAQAGRSRP